MKLRYSIFLLILGLFVVKYSESQVVKRVEPPFWWTEMKNPELHIMLYGDNLSEYQVDINHEGIQFKVQKVENANYAFLNLFIDSTVKPGIIPISLSKNNKIIQTVNYELKERTKDASQHQGFDNSDVVYLFMPDRFSNGDPSNDNAPDMLEKADRNNPDGRHGGDIQGITNHLDYFNELGVTTLWINPLLENNQEKYTYHGYAITDFYKIDPRYGNNQMYKDLVKQAHQKGLKVVKDMVLNHCGINHWWINDLPSEDWIHQFPEFTRSNFRSSALIDPYASDYDKRLQQIGWFDTNMPDLNQKNELLATYLIQNAIWWIEYSGIDGIRLDTQPYADKEMVASWAKAIQEEYPEFTILGESWLQKIALTAYWQESTSNHDGYSSNIPVITDFPMFNAISAAFNEEQTWTEGIARLYYVLAQDFLYKDASKTLVFLDNHDVNRIYTSLQKDIRKLKMAIAFQLTTRGIPSVYCGTEQLQEGLAHESHGKMRMDFPGGWPDDKQNTFTSEGRTDDQNEIFNYFQTLLHWRKTTPAIHDGQLTHFVPENNVYVYFRHTENECVMVILNNNKKKQTISTEKFNEILSGYTKGKEIITGFSMKNLDMIDIQEKSAMIIELYK
jgi:glycosidase